MMSGVSVVALMVLAQSYGPVDNGDGTVTFENAFAYFMTYFSYGWFSGLWLYGSVYCLSAWKEWLCAGDLPS